MYLYQIYIMNISSNVICTPNSVNKLNLNLSTMIPMQLTSLVSMSSGGGFELSSASPSSGVKGLAKKNEGSTL